MPKSVLNMTVRVTQNKICESESLLGTEMLSMQRVSDQSMLVMNRNAPSVVQMRSTTKTILFVDGVVLS